LSLLFIFFLFFFLNAPPTPHIYTLSLHDALPISSSPPATSRSTRHMARARPVTGWEPGWRSTPNSSCPTTSCRSRKEPLRRGPRSEEHTSELQSRFDLVCRLLLEKKKQKNKNTTI